MKRAPALAAALDATLTYSELAKRVPQACRAQVTCTTLAMRSGGASISDEKRDELLAKCAAGDSYVELEVDVLAFEQQRDVHNRNFVEFREGALVALGRSGKNTPV